MGALPRLELGDVCGLNRATAWRILSTLESHGLVVSDRSSGHWTLGPGLVDIARSAGSEVVLRDVHAVLQHVAMQTGETAALAVARNGTLAYVDEVAPDVIVSASWSGQQVEPARDLDGEGAAGLVDAGGAGASDATTAEALHRHHDHRPRGPAGRAST